MLVFRSLSLGLLGACFMLLLTRPTEIRIVQRAVPQVSAPQPAATIIDVASGVSSAQLAALIRLGPSEHITKVDDGAIANDVAAGVVLASVALSSRRYIDVEVAGPAGERRVLVLLH